MKIGAEFTFLMVVIAVCILGVVIAASCPDPPPSPDKGVGRLDGGASHEDDSTEPGSLCMPCVGPHIDLSTGNFSVFGMGPGLSL